VTIRGYVYVFTNEGLPGLVKVGFSLKDPALRATELSTTGVPHPYVVEYDVLVLNPIEVEQSVHRAFREEGRHEAKEFFRVTVSDAITKINETIVKQGKTILLENTSMQSQPSGTSGTLAIPDAEESAKDLQGQLICPRCRTLYSHRSHCTACQVALVPVASIIDTGAAFYCPECGKDSDRDSFCRYCQSKVVRKR
jgi:predicted RNA-binding Zn-ribbon protein involved in translation (DUF1610 family)